MAFFPIVQGFVLGASMIIPIGAQNAFVLNQGIKRQHHLVAASICMLCDFVLIAIGIYGGSQIISSSDWAFSLLTWAGILFLIVYGGISFRSAKSLYTNMDTTKQEVVGGGLDDSPMQEEKGGKILSKVVITCMAVTLLNPHVYLDTVVILGGVGGQFESDGKFNFTLGCMLASVVWFFGLAILAARMSGFLSRPKVKIGIDLVVGLIMWVVAGFLFNSWY